MPNTTCLRAWHGVHRYEGGVCVRCGESVPTRTYDSSVAQALQETSDERLDVTDRCDRCGAQAKSRVTLRTGDLLFCSHHFRQHADALARCVKVPRAL